MKVLEVRCCCDPGLLLGWLQVPDHAQPGMRLHFGIARRGPWTTPDPGQPVQTVDVVEVALDVATISWTRASWRPGRPAVKSNDTPIEILRLIPGFTEA